MSDLVKDSNGLTPRQRRLADLWIKAKVTGADIVYAELAKAAGYQGNSREALDVTASRTLRLPSVSAYLKQRAIEEQNADALDVVLELRALRKDAASEAVRKDILLDQAKGMGLLHATGGPTGPAIAVHITLTDPAAGAQMAQLLAMADNHKVIQGHATVEHALAEGEGGRKAKRATPPPGQARAGGAAPGVKNAARSPAALPRARLPRKTSPSGNLDGPDGDGPPE